MKNTPISRDEAIEILQIAKDSNAYGYIEVTIPGQKRTEYIVNYPESLDYKIEYYKRTYNSEGVHNNCPDIRMVSAGWFVDAEVDYGDE